MDMSEKHSVCLGASPYYKTLWPTQSGCFLNFCGKLWDNFFKLSIHSDALQSLSIIKFKTVLTINASNTRQYQFVNHLVVEHLHPKKWAVNLI